MGPLARRLLRPFKYIHDSRILFDIKYPHTTRPDGNLHFKVFNGGSNITKQIEHRWRALDGSKAGAGKPDLLPRGSCQKAFNGDSYIF